MNLINRYKTNGILATYTVYIDNFSAFNENHGDSIVSLMKDIGFHNKKLTFKKIDTFENRNIYRYRFGTIGSFHLLLSHASMLNTASWSYVLITIKKARIEMEFFSNRDSDGDRISLVHISLYDPSDLAIVKEMWEQ